MSKIRKAARTVILDGDKVAILEVGGGEYYKIPGGGMEEGETEEQAAKREAREEAGCEVELIERIGGFDFSDEENKDVIHSSACYLAKAITHKESVDFTEEEKKEGFKLLWVTIDEALKMFEVAEPKFWRAKMMNNRDYNFLKKAKEILSHNS
jgi:8-oxo-dGTP pyrophosphatase MutT (NUDIX family)